MVDLTYVKKRRRRKVTAIVTGVTGVLLIPFLILSFIGREIGHFNVALKNSKVALALSVDEELKDTTTLISLKDIPAYAVYSNDAINRYYTDEMIDTVSSNDQIGKRVNPNTNETSALYFFKYTFYVTNVGEMNACYDLKLSITDNKRPSNVNYSLDDILRVRWYENDKDSTAHNYVTYAKKSLTPHFNDGDTTPNYDTCIGANDSNGMCKDGYATQFEDDTVILSENINHFKVKDTKRYTLLMWLEGNDPEAFGTTPDETYLKLAINIEAYEEVNN